MDLIRDYWWLLAVAAAVIVLFLLLRPRQRVTLTDSAGTRPHMQQSRQKPDLEAAESQAGTELPAEGRGIAGEAAAATSDVTGDIINAPVHKALEGDAGANDLCRLKGVGPKFAQALHAQGVFTFDQLAGLSGDELQRIDSQLGSFRGRIARDRIVEQAGYLARDDVDGFEEKFGKL